MPAPGEYMEKRVLLAIFLTFVVLFAYQALFLKESPAPAPAQKVVAPEAAAKSDAAGAAAVEPAAAPSAAPAAGEQVASAAPAATVADTEERRVVVETALLRVEFNNRGARVEQWHLNRFKNDQGQPVDFVPEGLGASATRPFELKVDDEAISARLRQALFTGVESSGTTVDGRRGPVQLAFEYSDASGLQARKVFRFRPDSYVVEVSAEVSTPGRRFNPTILLGAGLGDVRGASSNKFLQAAQGILHREGKVERLDAKKVTAGPVQEGTFRFAGVDDHYFISAVLPARMARVEYQMTPVPGADGTTLNLVSYGVRVAERAEAVKFFLGPKEFDVLRSVDGELVRAINYGFFSWLAVPLLSGLKGINQYVHNYGWSIIILTVLLNIAMFPLRHKSVVSMRRIQELKPEIDAINERYAGLKKTDPAQQKKQQEMMELYKTRGVNPASGCIPMLLTIPVLFAFYSLLSQAIELRGAPFALWITDLSAHDPYYVTPILMGVTWLWQQWITPSGTDPVQQKMMLAMPIVFTFMFLRAPSGLAIYWFLNNLLGIVQQYATNAIAGPAPVPVRATASPGRTRVKRGSQGSKGGSGGGEQ